jgi:hypothetical protein
MVTRTSLVLLAFAASAALAAGCSSSTTGEPAAKAGCNEDTECSGDAPVCDRASGLCVATILGGELGNGDGSSSSVTFTEVYRTGGSAGPVDLEFDPRNPGDLWVIGYVDSSVHVGKGLDGDSPSWARYVDPAARHFMHKPPAIAIGDNGFWATCGDNDNPGTPNFMGPALFTTDLEIFAKPTPGGLGSHYDMLHATPFCRGIAHVEENVYWLFNAHDESLDKYNFNEDHGPGEDDHSDGEIYRYAAGQVKGADNVVSHVFYDHEDKHLYVADTGNKRIVRLDTTSGTKGGPLPRRNEPLKANAFMEGTEVEEIVPPGVLEQPSGIEVHNGLIYVTDAAMSSFHVFDKTGKEIRLLETDLPGGSLAGFTFGFDGKIWFTDRTTGRVLRIDTE